MQAGLASDAQPCRCCRCLGSKCGILSPISRRWPRPGTESRNRPTDGGILHPLSPIFNLPLGSFWSSQRLFSTTDLISMIPPTEFNQRAATSSPDWYRLFILASEMKNVSTDELQLRTKVTVNPLSCPTASAQPPNWEVLLRDTLTPRL